MTSLWLVALMATLVAPSADVKRAVQALEQHHDVRADTLAQRYLQHLPPYPYPNDDDVVTAKLVSALARLRGDLATDALSGLDLLAQEHIDLGPQGAALRVQALARLDACHEAFRAARTLLPQSLWAQGAYQQVASCMLRHNPTLPVRSPIPEGVALVAQTLERLGQDSESPQDAARSWLLAGRLKSAWGDAQGADDIFANLVRRYGSLTDGVRAKHERLTLRRDRRLTTPMSARAPLIEPGSLGLDAAAQRRILMSRTERLALRRASQNTRRKNTPSSTSYALATLNLARLEQVDSHYSAAQMWLSQVLAHQPHASPLAVQAYALRGDVAMLQGQLGLAQRSWQQAASAMPEHPWGTVALLHDAAASAGRGDTARGRKLLQQARLRQPLGEDLLMVRDDGAALVLTEAALKAEIMRLGHALGVAPQAAPAVAPAHIASPSWSPVVSSGEELGSPWALGRPHVEAPDLAAVELLIDHHLPGTARALMRQLPAQDLRPNERLVAAYLYARLGDPFRANLLMLHCDEACRAQDPSAAWLAHLMPFEKDVQRFSQRAHVPAALVYAIMREESGFGEGVTSGRGARGLMQLMPRTAVQLARQTRLPAPSPQALMHHETNIALGAQLLGELYRHFHGNIAAVAAAYQAGQPKAQHWLELAQARHPQVPLHLVIPLASTRIYVQHIEASFERYRAQLGQAAPKHKA